MKNFTLLSILLLSLAVFSQNSEPLKTDSIQKKSNKFYSSAGGEMIFSFVNTNSDAEQTALRFSMWYHVNIHLHYDFSKTVGAYTGFTMRNVGFTTKGQSNDVYFDGEITKYNAIKGVYEYPANSEITTVKRRAYTVGIPIALKIGNLKKNQFAFLGGEFEIPFHYKQKIWVDEKKYKNTEWFSKQTNPFLLSAFVGYQFKTGMNVKLKWYLTDFLNQDYKDVASDNKPYEGLQTQMFYISFGMNLYNPKRGIKQIKKTEIKATYSI